MVKLHIKILFFILLLYAPTIMSAQYRWRNVLITDSLSPQNDISAIVFAKNGGMWIGTWKGIYKFVDGKWISDGLENHYIQALVIDHNDNLLAGTWGNGIFLKNTSNGSWNVLNNKVSNVNCIYVDKEDKLWIGDCYNGLIVLDGKTHTKQKVDKLCIGDSTVTSVVSDFDGNVWIATYHGVSVYHRNVGSKTFNTSNSILPTNDIYTLYVDSKKRVWIGTMKGLVCYCHDKWMLYNTNNASLSSNLIYCISEDHKGNIWVGTDNGVNRFDGKRWIYYNKSNSSLVDNRVQTITAFRHCIYLGTSQGISELYEN